MRRYNFVYEVQSSSNPEKKYTIKMRDDGMLTCNCPSWIFNTRRNRTCKHVDVIKRAGFTADEKGKFIVTQGHWGDKAPVFCKNYPQQCDECKLRFFCYTEHNPEFTEDELEDAGVIKMENTLHGKVRKWDWQ